MRKLRGGGGEKVGVLAFEVAALMSRAASLWRALGPGGPLARLRGGEEALLRLEGVRRLVADDDAALLALAAAEVAAACRDLARAVARLATRCADPLLRRFAGLFAALVARGAGADGHGMRYAAQGKMDRKARKMQRLVATTAYLCHELAVLADLEHALQRRHGSSTNGRLGEAARRVARQRQEVERLRAASLWNRSFDYAVRLLARSLFTIVARVIEVFDLEPTAVTDSADKPSSRLSWSSSFVGNSAQYSTVYPSDITADTARRMQRAKSGNQFVTTGGDSLRFLMSRSKSLKQQLRWPAGTGKHLIGCVVGGGRSPPPTVRNEWGHAGELPLSLSYHLSLSASHDDYCYSGSGILKSQADHRHSGRLSTSVFESSQCDLLASAPATSLGGAALAVHYAHLIILIERLAAAPHHICSDEREELYGMLTDGVRASLRPRLRPLAKQHHWSLDPVGAAEWADTVQGILGWLAPLAHNMIRWQAERNFEQRNVASGASVLLLQTLHFADQRKTEAAVVELLVGLNYLWRSGREMEAKANRTESTGSGDYEDCTDYVA